MHRHLVVPLLGLALPICSGCAARSEAADSPQSAIAQGRAYIGSFGCGACHEVPGIKNADGVIGPPLTRFALRAYIAGEVPNTPANLVQWLENPQSIEPKTAMPNLQISEPVAKAMAAYLGTLR